MGIVELCCCNNVTVADGVPLPEDRWRVIGSGNLQLSDVISSDTSVYVCTLHEASLTAAASLVVYGMYCWLPCYVLFNSVLITASAGFAT